MPSNWTDNRALTWLNGIDLASIGNTTFTYNGEGQRVSKTTGATTTSYTYEGDQLVMQTTGNTNLFFLYDSNGLIGFDHIVSGTTTAKVNEINNMHRFARKVYLRNNTYGNSQAKVNMNLKTFGEAPISANIKLIESQITIFRVGVYATVSYTITSDMIS